MPRFASAGASASLCPSQHNHFSTPEFRIDNRGNDLNPTDSPEAASDESAPAESAAPRCRLRLVIATAIVVLLAIIAFSGWWAQSAQQQARAAAAIVSMGGKVKYADEMPFATLSPPARWLMTWRGHDWASAVVSVNLSGAKITEQKAAALSQLPSLSSLWLNGAEIDDADLACLENLSRLEELYLANTPVSDESVVHLARLKRLRFLSLAGTKITDSGLRHLTGLNQIVRLDLPETNVTSAGVAELQQSLRTTKIVYSSSAGIRASSISRDTGKQIDGLVPKH
jgi:hypothetical protein